MRVLRGLVALWLAATCMTVLAQTQVLPDFTRLVEEQGSAVVNISTTQAVRRTSALPQSPGMEGDQNKRKLGACVVAPGAHFGFDNTVTPDIVSAKGRSLPQENFVPFIQTDVAINPGNSGGPLFNIRGEVVGINSQIYSRTGGFMGLSFAIPIDVALDIQKQLRDKGRVARGR